MDKFKLWTDTKQNNTEIYYYPSTYKVSKASVLIFPGGAYFCHADYEGEGYAEMINSLGLDAFVVKYRVLPDRFPLPLLDARRAVRFIRANSEKFGLDKDKLLVMGSSAGGHLAALLSTYFDKIEGEGIDLTDNEEFIPNGQILCYPVICSDEKIGHMGSYENLLGNNINLKDTLSPELLVTDKTPKAFIWHTSSDSVVNVINSYRFAEALAQQHISCELHVFPVGDHGSALAPNNLYVSSWIELLRKWFMFNGLINSISSL